MVLRETLNACCVAYVLDYRILECRLQLGSTGIEVVGLFVGEGIELLLVAARQVGEDS